jgi:hypothetical protein
MKNPTKEILIVICLAAGILTSCSKDDPGASCGEKWQLVEMSGNVAELPPLRGTDMSWQESYLLRPDHTFIKTRQRDNSMEQAGGTWVLSTQSRGNELHLTYKAESDLIGSCITGLDEVLIFSNAGDRLMGTWSMCDGPGLTYEKVPYDCMVDCVASVGIN